MKGGLVQSFQMHQFASSQVSKFLVTGRVSSFNRVDIL